MKKLEQVKWDIRCWLIHKLGGYDRQQVVLEKPTVIHVDPGMEKVAVYSQIKVPSGRTATDVAEETYMKNVAEREMMRDLFQNLYRLGAISVDATERVPGFREYRLTIAAATSRRAVFIDPTWEKQARVDDPLAW